MLYCLYFLLGCIVTMIGYKFYESRVTTKKTMGVLNIDRSDPDGPFLFLEISTSVEEISKHKTVILSINNKNYLSQK